MCALTFNTAVFTYMLLELKRNYDSLFELLTLPIVATESIPKIISKNGSGFIVFGGVKIRSVPLGYT